MAAHYTRTEEQVLRFNADKLYVFRIYVSSLAISIKSFENAHFGVLKIKVH